MISRRSLIAAGTVAGLAPTVISRRAAAEDQTLYVATYGGTIRQAETTAYFKPFTDATGIKIVPVEGVSLAKLKAAVQTGNYEFDVTVTDRIEVQQAVLEGLLEKVDYSVLNKDNIVPGGIVADAAIPIRALGTCLCYRKDKFPNGGPKSWADFWDVKKFPGNRALYNQFYTILGFALLADGVPLDKLYPMDIDRAFRKMDEIKPHIKVWWTQGNQSETLIHDGEVDMISLWNARAQAQIDQGTPIEIVWNGTQDFMGYYTVPKGTPRAKLAWRYLEFVHQAKNQAAFSNILPYGPANPKAFEFMDPAKIAMSPTSPEHAKVSFTPDAEWLGPRMASLRERWAQWLAS